MQLQEIFIYKHCMMCSYFQLKIRLLTSVVVGIETFMEKKKNKTRSTTMQKHCTVRWRKTWITQFDACHWNYWKSFHLSQGGAGSDIEKTTLGRKRRIKGSKNQGTWVRVWAQTFPCLQWLTCMCTLLCWCDCESFFYSNVYFFIFTRLKT